MRFYVKLARFRIFRSLRNYDHYADGENEQALAERLAVLNTDEPMPPAEGPEDVAPGPGQGPTRNLGLGSFATVTLYGSVGDALRG